MSKFTKLVVIFLSFIANVCHADVSSGGSFELLKPFSFANNVVFAEPAEEGTVYLSCDTEKLNLSYNTGKYNEALQPIVALISVLKNGDQYLNQVNENFDADILFQILTDKEVKEVIVITDKTNDVFSNYGLSKDLMEMGGACQNTTTVSINQYFPTKG